MIDTSTKGVISVWAGISKNSINEFNKYTEDMEIPNSGCPAHLDFGVSFIDSDFFVAYRTNNGAIVSIEDLFLEIGTNSKKTDAQIIKKAKEIGIFEGNSIYYYQNATFHEKTPGGLYNSLRFLGSFSDPKKNFR